MCRNIKTLFNFEPPATDEEIEAAALQFVRKLSGFTKPSRANEAAFAVASGPRERGQNGNLVISRGLLARDDLNNELRNWMKPQMKNWKRKLWTPAAFMASVILSLPGFVGLAAAEQRVETQPRQPSQHRRSARPRPPRRFSCRSHALSRPAKFSRSCAPPAAATSVPFVQASPWAVDAPSVVSRTRLHRCRPTAKAHWTH